MAGTTQTLHDKYLEIQKLLKVPKAQNNSFGGYKFRSAEDIVEAAKPLCHARGLSLKLSDEVLNKGDRYYVKAVAILSDGEKEIFTTAEAREQETRKGMGEDQITGAASSYARKYALNGLFAIDDTADADHHSAEQNEVSTQEAAEEQSDADRLLELKGQINAKMEKYGFNNAVKKKAFISKVLGKSTLDSINDVASIDAALNLDIEERKEEGEE